MAASQTTNTWPPLISGVSTDLLGRHQLLGNDVLASALIEAKVGDPFFFPSGSTICGYGADGWTYTTGVRQGSAPNAPWWAEAAGDFRGPVPEFPTKALVLVTDAGISIINVLDRYETWMIFQRGDTLGFANNYRGDGVGYTPFSASYADGRITIGMTPDPGSQSSSNVFLIIDFVLDQMYIDAPHYTPPALGGYLQSPVTYPPGVEITPNTPNSTGGAVLRWTIQPYPPSGIDFDPTSGIISGTPSEASAETIYTVGAWNPEGSATCTVDITVGTQVFR